MSDYLDLIKKYEGLLLKPYKCAAGYPTIGYGSRFYEDGEEVKMSDPWITKKQAEALLRDYVIKNILPKISPLGLTNNQETALISLLYNIGWTAFAKSKCYKAIKAKDWATALKNWDWYSGDGKVLNGLIKRRAEEIGLFFTEIK